MTLLFLPVTGAELADWQAAGVFAGPLKAYAATPGLVAAFEASDDEEAEHRQCERGELHERDRPHRHETDPGAR